MKDTQSNKYQITINAPHEKGWTHEHILEVLHNNFKTLIYVCMADEQGSCYHTHIFVVFTSRVRFSMIKHYFEEAHIEKCQGSVSDNVNYVKKSGKWELDESKQEKKIENTFEEYGTQPPDSRGKRNDMSELYQMVIDNMSNADILAVNQDYILYIDKIEKLRYTIAMDKYKDYFRENLIVTYIYGATGTGKTKYVMQKNKYSNTYRITDYHHPFDGYSYQPVICFDEFRSSLKLTEMLDYLDKHPCELPSRYSNKVACYEKVYIISNWSLEEQYTDIQLHDGHSWKAFLRRINHVMVFNSDGIINEYDSVDEYFKRDEIIKLDDYNQEELPFKDE